MPSLALVFLIAWASLLWGISSLGGWGRLARHYRARRAPTGERLRWQTVRLDRGIAFRGSISASLDERGLHLRVWPIYRAFHPPLLIPWEDLRARRQGPATKWGRLLVAPTVVLSARLAPEVPLIVSEAMAARLEEKLCGA